MNALNAVVVPTPETSLVLNTLQIIDSIQHYHSIALLKQ